MDSRIEGFHRPRERWKSVLFLWSRETRQAYREYPKIFQVGSTAIETDKKLQYSYRLENIGKRKIPAKTFVVTIETNLERGEKWTNIENPPLKSGEAVNGVQDFDFSMREDGIYYVGASFCFKVREGVGALVYRRGISKIVLKNKEIVSIENYETGADWENSWKRFDP